MDDILCVFRCDETYLAFLSALNCMHPNLRFTYELGPSVLPFLDTEISLPSIDGDGIITNVFRKPTYTGLLLNYNALCPQKWKIGLINCMIHCAYTVCCNWTFFSTEIDTLKDFFKSNGYPVNIFSSCVNRFVNSKFCQITKSVQEETLETIFIIPYIGMPSVVFGRKVKQLFKNNYNISVKVVYNTYKVKNYFSLKSRTPFPLSAKVVYKYQCLCDTNLVYIGKTKRHLVTRVKEHRTRPSAIKSHLDGCETCSSHFSIDSFEIVDRANNDYACKIKESLHIKEQQPALNTQLITSGASFVLNIF